MVEPLVLNRWAPRDLSRALRAGREVVLRTHEIGDWRPEEVGPLCQVGPWPEWAAPVGGVRRSTPRVTVVIPSNRAANLRLQPWLAQDEAPEVLVIWNGVGAEPELPGVTVITLPWTGHGPTRQAALAHVKTPYVLFSVDDAVPLGAGFIRVLVGALQRGPDAVWARQVPWPDASVRARDRLRAWCPADGRAPPTRLDHVCALHRVQTLLDDPLDGVAIAEDWLWGRRHRCALVPEAPVLHSHAPSLTASLRRTRMIHSVMYQAGEGAAVSGLSGLLRGLPGVRDRDGLGELLGQWMAGRG